MLTDTVIRNAARRGKPYKLHDERGLYLLVSAAGGKLWRFKYRFAGKEKVLALGQYPDVPLKAAREKRVEARQLVAAGKDPGVEKKVTRERLKASAVGTFEAVAREWLKKFASRWTPATAATKLRRFEIHVFPRIGARPIRDITAPDLLAVIRRVEATGRHDTAHRVHQLCGEVFRYAIATDRADRDPSGDLRGAFSPAVVTNRAAVTEPAKVGAILRMYDRYDGYIVTRCALRLAPLVFVRPGELRQAEWSEVDFDKGEWTIPAWKMKMRNSHTVPLSRQAIAILRELQPVTGEGRYVFPSGRTGERPMSDNAVLAAMRRMGIPKDEMSGHGWRAVARTLIAENLEQLGLVGAIWESMAREIVEHQLAHLVKDATGEAYNRTKFLRERRQMMQAWADYLDTLRAAKVSEKRA
ncbi:MAG TPA: integrase arm-type DNA-binding domain-containing protein [Thermoanaerobaculia bacterium]|nr:integrase arm-type DNA-binding domain-containing protein [Thermoanaerobaculia bacterium]